MWRPGSKINGLKSPTDVFEKLQLNTVHTVHPSDLVHVIPSITTHRKGMPGCGDLRVRQWTQGFCHSSSVLISLDTLFTTVRYVSYFIYHMLFLCYYTLDKNHLWILSCRCLNCISDTSKHTQNRPRLFNRWLFDLRFMSDTSVPGAHSRGAARPHFREWLSSRQGSFSAVMRSSEILSNSDQFQMFPNQNSPKDFIVSMNILPSASMIESRVAKGHVSFVEHSTTARSSRFTFLPPMWVSKLLKRRSREPLTNVAGGSDLGDSCWNPP